MHRCGADIVPPPLEVKGLGCCCTEGLFPHLERSLQQRSVHRCHTLQLLPCVLIEVFAVIKAHVATTASGLAFGVTAGVAALGDDVVVVATRAARVSFAYESGGGVEQKEPATGLYVLLHRVHDGCGEETQVEEILCWTPWGVTIDRRAFKIIYRITKLGEHHPLHKICQTYLLLLAKLN